jgi:hypothetical protein
MSNTSGNYCGSKRPPRGRDYGAPSFCFKRGLRAGFAAGIQKGQEKQVKRSAIAKNVARAAPKDFKSMSKDTVRDMAREKGVKNYSKMSKDQLVEKIATPIELRRYRS